MNHAFEERFLAARRRYIESQFSGLNPMQRTAALTTEGPLLLLAGAGSGKTTVLINRIANLIRFGSGYESNSVPYGVTGEDASFLENLKPILSAQERERADELCRENAPAPWQIMAITFTNKADGELKERLCSMLGSEGSEVWAMTFHAACCRILRRDSELLGFTRSFTIYDTADSERVMKDILKDRGLD